MALRTRASIYTGIPACVKYIYISNLNNKMSSKHNLPTIKTHTRIYMQLPFQVLEFQLPFIIHQIWTK